VLGDIGLDPARFVVGLIAFNVGVELGQLAVIAVAFLAVGLWFGKKQWYRAYIAVPASVVIGLVGAYWAVERTFF
jgi:type IV secretory pathway VirB2 component (pilin)